MTIEPKLLASVFPPYYPQFGSDTEHELYCYM